MSTQRWAEIDLGAIAFNTRSILEALGPDVRLLAVVKAQGYGHGALQVAKTALEAGAWGLVVSTPEEAGALKHLVDGERLIVVGGMAQAAAARAARLKVAVAASSLEVLEVLEAAASGERLPVHLKIDTGMGRLGCRPGEAARLAQRLVASPRLRLAGVMTHFAAADSEPAYTRAQIRIFDESLAEIRACGIDPGMVHAANSAGALNHPEARYGAVRCGLALYGYGWPALKPALTLKALVVRVHEIQAGCSVGYGRLWTARRPSRIATLAIGYEDGVLRARSNQGEVVIGGHRAPLVGAVSMDSVTVDVTGLDQVRLGDEAILIGQGIGADQVGDWSSTIAYEVLTALGERVERRFLE